MIRWNYPIRDEEGLHARPIARIVMELQGFSCRVTVTGAGGQADGRDLMDLMSLHARQGETLEFSFDGQDEEEASEAMQELLAAVGL